MLAHWTAEDSMYALLIRRQGYFWGHEATDSLDPGHNETTTVQINFIVCLSRWQQYDCTDPQFGAFKPDTRKQEKAHRPPRCKPEQRIVCSLVFD